MAKKKKKKFLHWKYGQWLCSTAPLPFPDSRWLQEDAPSDTCPMAVILCDKELDVAVDFQLCRYELKPSLTGSMTTVFKTVALVSQPGHTSLCSS